MKNCIEVSIISEYDNSLCMNITRTYKGIISWFEVTPVKYHDACNEVIEYSIKFKLKDGSLKKTSYDSSKVYCCSFDDATFEETLPPETYFAGFGKMIWNNSGPDCSLIIKPLKGK